MAEVNFPHGDRKLRIIVDGDKLSAHRRDCGYTQKALAEACGVTPRSIARIEQQGEDGQPVYRRTFRALCKALMLKTKPEQDSLLVIPPGQMEWDKDLHRYVKVPLAEVLRRERIAEALGDR